MKQFGEFIIMTIKPWDFEKTSEMDDDEIEKLYLDTVAEDYIFCIHPDYVAITPKEFFKQESVMFDQHLDIDHLLPEDFGYEMEGVYSTSLPPKQARKILISLGFVEDSDFTRFVGGIEFSDPVKISTEICKKEICKYVKANVDKIAKEFFVNNDDEFKEIKNSIRVKATDEKNWKRLNKRKEGNKVVRSFDCAPFDDQLRAYVTSNTNDTVIESVEVCGE